jgi:hypothetical protein
MILSDLLNYTKVNDWIPTLDLLLVFLFQLWLYPALCHILILSVTTT